MNKCLICIILAVNDYYLAITEVQVTVVYLFACLIRFQVQNVSVYLLLKIHIR